MKRELNQVERELHDQQQAAIEVPAKPLTGDDLLAMVDRMSDASKSDLVRACGYVSERKEGGERLEFTRFHDALVQAR